MFFQVNKDNVCFLWEDKKGIQNKTNSPTRIFASITNVETTMSIAINCFAPSFIFYHLELLNILCFISKQRKCLGITERFLTVYK